MHVLVVNSGSSSLKLRLLDDDEVVAARDLPASAADEDRGRLEGALADFSRIDAVGHRIVHGGERFREAVRIDPGVVGALRELVPLAPLHQQRSLAALEAVSGTLSDVPAVACFDTAFHATLAPAAATYALPADWRKRFGLRRYGFHGLSHAHVSRRAAQLLGREDLRLVSCHLGAGASLAAVRSGRSVDTTMGFTPLEGLVMATRSGSVDPGMVVWLLDQADIALAELADALEHRSGLQGIAGTAEMEEVIGQAEGGDERARLALDVYGHRLRAAIAAMAAAIEGIDCLVFTGGVGEHAAAVRASAARGLGFLGIELDPARNAAAQPDREIGAADAPVRTLVVRAREDLEISRQVRSLLAG